MVSAEPLQIRSFPQLCYPQWIQPLLYMKGGTYVTVHGTGFMGPGNDYIQCQYDNWILEDAIFINATAVSCQYFQM